METRIHMFVECRKVKYVFQYFKDMLNKICKMQITDSNKILHLDFKGNKRQVNTAVIMVTTYIGCIWYSRSSIKCIEAQDFKTNIIKQNHMLHLILKDNIIKYFTEEFCKVTENM